MCKLVHSYRLCRHAHFGEPIPCPSPTCFDTTTVTYRGNCPMCQESAMYCTIYKPDPKDGYFDNAEYHELHGHNGISCILLPPPAPRFSKRFTGVPQLDGAAAAAMPEVDYAPIKLIKHGKHGKKVSVAGPMLLPGTGSKKGNKYASGNNRGASKKGDDIQMDTFKERKVGGPSGVPGDRMSKAVWN